MNQVTLTAYNDFETFPHPYLKAMVNRLHSELFAAAKALRGELLDVFWQSIDEVNALRDPSVPANDAASQRLICLDGDHQKALIMRLRIDMFSVAKAFQGELLDSFWRSIDELNTIRPTK